MNDDQSNKHKINPDVKVTITGPAATSREKSVWFNGFGQLPSAGFPQGGINDHHPFTYRLAYGVGWALNLVWAFPAYAAAASYIDARLSPSLIGGHWKVLEFTIEWTVFLPGALTLWLTDRLNGADPLGVSQTNNDLLLGAILLIPIGVVVGLIVDAIIRLFYKGVNEPRRLLTTFLFVIAVASIFFATSATYLAVTDRSLCSYTTFIYQAYKNLPRATFLERNAQTEECRVVTHPLQ